MSPEELSILNALVTFAAENVPGGLSPEERAVAKKVGQWALDGRPVSARSRIAYMGDDG